MILQQEPCDLVLAGDRGNPTSVRFFNDMSSRDRQFHNRDPSSRIARYDARKRARPLVKMGRGLLGWGLRMEGGLGTAGPHPAEGLGGVPPLGVGWGEDLRPCGRMGVPQ